MNQYKLIFTVSFDEQDDPAARNHAAQIMETLGKFPGDLKLQQTYPDKPPRGVRLD